MISYLLFDLPTLGAFALAAVLIATVYLIYRDIRLIMQMMNDLREEFMMMQLASAHGGADEDEESDDDEDGDYIVSAEKGDAEEPGLARNEDDSVPPSVDSDRTIECAIECADADDERILTAIAPRLTTQTIIKEIVE